MKTFTDFLTEDDDYSAIHPVHKLLTKAQRKTLEKHKDYKTYIAPPPYSEHKVLARKDDRWKKYDEDSHLKHYVIASTHNGAKYRMSVALSRQGKYYNHEIHRRDDNEPNTWHHVKSGHSDKD